MKKDWNLQTIGIIHSPFKQKFGIPRQSGLAPTVKATLELYPPYNHPDSVAGLSQFSHLWLSFIFHQAIAKKWNPSVRPPRLGGNKKMGVFATRSPYRANPLGLSVVKLEQVKADKKEVILHLSGIDLLDQTPIVDIKPYIKYSDCLPSAQSGFAQKKPQAVLEVVFSEYAQQKLSMIDNGETIQMVLKEVLALDPRPAYRTQDDEHSYGLVLFDLDVHWKIKKEKLIVLDLKKLS